MREGFVEEAMKYLGLPSVRYRGESHGKSPESGFDCSGFIVFLLEKLKIPNPLGLRHTNELFDHFGVLVHAELRQRGDLVFFSRNGLVPTHVGILTSPFTYIHAPGKEKTVVECAALKFSGIEPMSDQIYIMNPIGFKRITIPDGRYQKTE